MHRDYYQEQQLKSEELIIEGKFNWIESKPAKLYIDFALLLKETPLFYSRKTRYYFFYLPNLTGLHKTEQIKLIGNSWSKHAHLLIISRFC